MIVNWANMPNFQVTKPISYWTYYIFPQYSLVLNRTVDIHSFIPLIWKRKVSPIDSPRKVMARPILMPVAPRMGMGCCHHHDGCLGIQGFQGEAAQAPFQKPQENENEEKNYRDVKLGNLQLIQLIVTIVEAQFTQDKRWVEGNTTLNGFIIQLMTGGTRLVCGFKGNTRGCIKTYSLP